MKPMLTGESFGSHVANVLRRLIRIAQYYGVRPQFILTSATIANPTELASNLTELDMILIDQDGSGRGPKTFILYNPPVIEKELGLRRSALQESVRLAQDLLTYQVQTILFARSRRTVEIILSYLRQSAGTYFKNTRLTFGQENQQRIRGYRSGYLPKKRREIGTRVAGRFCTSSGCHKCARAWDRYRRDGSGLARWLSRYHCSHLAASWARRARFRALTIRDDCCRRSAGPVPGSPSRIFL